LGQQEAPVNGSREHPAIITAVHSDQCVNLTVFFDAQQPEPRTSVLHADTAVPGAMCWYSPPAV
jgi:hypothetical protein